MPRFFTAIALFVAALGAGCSEAVEDTGDAIGGQGSADGGATDARRGDAARQQSDAARRPDAEGPDDQRRDAALVADALPDAGSSGDPDVFVDPVEPPQPDLGPPDAAPGGPAVTCRLRATPPGELEVNTWRGSVDRAELAVADVPDSARINRATLHYAGYDMDQPGEEGWLQINDSPPIPLPADRALDNQSAVFALDVTGRLVAGRNRVTFLAFDRPAGSFYRVSDVVLEVTGPQLECPQPPPRGQGVERVLGYRDARYEQRRNWVVACRDYAYTAQADEHRACDADYNPDRSTHGRAVFVFADVIQDRYEVAVEGRNTTNRNPAGALVIVNGVERRLNQRDDREFVFVPHGEYDLGGEVTVIVDSTRERGSDSVRRVRLRPVR